MDSPATFRTSFKPRYCRFFIELGNKKTELDKIEHVLRRVEKRDRMLHKDFSEERAVLEEVFDKSTLMVIYDLMNRGVISEIFGSVKSGKESKLYWGLDPEGRELAIKIYLTTAAEFKRGMLVYIEGDPRFRNIRRDTKSLIYAWAQKEFKNLIRAKEAKVRVPEPIAVSKNVLVMEFIGRKGVCAPLLREVELKNPTRIYRRLILYIKRLYQKAGLVHADLSEYNIMIWRRAPVIFDMSQAVLVGHPMTEEFLKRDLRNLNNYFAKMGVEVLSYEEVFRKVRG